MVPAPAKTIWGSGLHQSFRLLPSPSRHLRPFLEGEGKTPEEILAQLPYDAARSKNPGNAPDPKRYRDSRQVYETAGLLFEGEDGIVHTTTLGKATLRWLNVVNEKNVFILGRHAAYALAACQLSNPLGAGRNFEASVIVFPFAFIWHAMLSLDGWITTEELNRAIFKVKNQAELQSAIHSIHEARVANDFTLLGEETVTGKGKNDRIIPWMSIASFGWTLIFDKDEGGGVYRIKPRAVHLLKEAAAIRHRHRTFVSGQEYIEHVAKAAALPEDLR
jgi:hypothetical protein